MKMVISVYLIVVTLTYLANEVHYPVIKCMVLVRLRMESHYLQTCRNW